jgi:L-fucose dehydrogenase
MQLGLEDKVFIVTGGAKGIGEGIVRLLSKEGAIPVIVGRYEDENISTYNSINKEGGKCHFITANLLYPETCKDAVEQTISKFGKIDGVVNNAGVNDGVGLEHGSYDGFIQSLHQNVVHYYLMVHHALSELKKSKGRIVNIGSKTAITGQGNTGAYAAANGGRNHLAMEWAREFDQYGIRANAVIVAECFTPQYKSWIRQFPDASEKLKVINDRIPLQKRMTTAEEIANMVVFLLSDKSAYINGQWLHVDGGYVHLDRAIR